MRLSVLMMIVVLSVSVVEAQQILRKPVSAAHAVDLELNKKTIVEKRREKKRVVSALTEDVMSATDVSTVSVQMVEDQPILLENSNRIKLRRNEENIQIFTFDFSGEQEITMNNVRVNMLIDGKLIMEKEGQTLPLEITWNFNGLTPGEYDVIFEIEDIDYNLMAREITRVTVH